MRNTVFAVLLVACFVGVAVAADADKNATSVARPDVVAPEGQIAVHPFVNVAAIEAATHFGRPSILVGVIHFFPSFSATVPVME